MAAGKPYAVLTGDIVASSRFIREQGGRIRELILEGELRVKEHFPSAVHGSIDIFRGDGWQMVVEEPVSSLRIVLLFRASLLAFAGIDSRVAVGYGPVDYLSEDDVSTGTGEAFTLSGTGLGEITKPVRLNLNFPPEFPEVETRALNTIASLIDLQVQRWTRKQAGAMAGALVGLTQRQIADSWAEGPISQQAVSQHLDNAGWSQLKKSLLFVEYLLASLLGLSG